MSGLRERLEPNRLGEMLRLYRTVKQLGLRDVALDIGISHATLMRIEHGQTFDTDTLFKLFQYLLAHHAIQTGGSPR